MKELPPGVASLLNSCQVITSVASVVKELIENSLDAHSTRIDVKLENSGFDKIEVRDNGDGIEQSDVEYAARPHYTSKISSEKDLQTLYTYGFRGEALGAICNVADVSIITKTRHDEVSINYKFDHSGKIVSSKPSSLGQGTSVIVENLFENVPVRRQFCSSAKKKKDEIKKVEDMIIAFASICPNVRFTVYHNQMQIWQKMSVCDVRSALLLTFGANMANILEYKTAKNEECKVTVDAFLPKPGLSVQQTSRTSSERCVVAVNSRPVRIKDIDKLLNTYYSHAYHIDNRWSRYPVCYISVNVPPSTIDVNIEPDKSSVLFHCTDIVLELLTSVLIKMYGELSEAEKSSLTRNQESENREKTCQNLVVSSCDKEMTSLSEECPISCNDSREVTKNQKSNNSNSTSLFNTKNSNDHGTVNSISSSVGANESCIRQEVDSHSHLQSQIPEFSLEDVVCSWLDNNNELIDKIMDVEKDNELLQNSKDDVPSANALTGGVDDTVDPVNALQGAANDKSSEWSRGAIRNKDGELIEPVSVLAPYREESRGLVLNQSSGPTTNNKKTAYSSKMSSPSKKKKRMEEIIGQPSVYDMYNKQPVRQPLTPYALFCKAKKPKVISVHPMAPSQTINNILKEKWQKLPTEKKKHYEMLSEEEKARHKEVQQESDLSGQKTNHDDIRLSKIALEQKQQSGKSIEVTPHKANRKEYTKYRPKETVIEISMEKLKKSNSEDRMEIETPGFSLVGQLDPSGMWINAHGEQIFAINHFRILEVIEYHRLVTQYHLSLTSLDSPIALSESVLGKAEIWNMLLNLKSERDDAAGYSSVTDEKLVGNGFDVRIFDGTAEIIRLTDQLPFYGVPDLVEILELIIQHGPATTLEECRPQKVVQFLQGEAVRNTRIAPSTLSIDKIKHILNDLQDLPDNYKSCLHGKPFFHLLYDLDEIPLTQTQS